MTLGMRLMDVLPPNRFTSACSSAALQGAEETEQKPVYSRWHCEGASNYSSAFAAVLLLQLPAVSC